MKTLIALLILLIPSIGLAQTEPTLKVKFKGGDYTITGSAMLIHINIPLVTTRLAVYGNILRTNKGERYFNLPKDTATPEGEEIYTRLMAIQYTPSKSDRKLFALNVVALNYSTISLLKYNSVEWGDCTKEIITILESIGKKKKD